MQHHSFPGTDIPAAYGAFSHAVEAGDFVFLAGQIARDPQTGMLIDGDVGAQTARCLEIVEQILAELGLTFRHIVRVTVYLSEIANFDRMNRVYQAIIKPPYPARSTPQAKLPYGALVGIEVTAYRGADNR